MQYYENIYNVEICLHSIIAYNKLIENKNKQLNIIFINQQNKFENYITTMIIHKR